MQAGVMVVVSFDADERSIAALGELTADGSTVSEAIGRALVGSTKLRRCEQMRAESLALLNDEVDLAETRRVQVGMGELRSW